MARGEDDTMVTAQFAKTIIIINPKIYLNRLYFDYMLN